MASLKKRRYAVSIRSQSIGVYEVMAESAEAAMKMHPDEIRKNKVLTFREEVHTEAAMSITMPDD